MNSNLDPVTLDRLDRQAAILSNQLEATVLTMVDLNSEVKQLRALIELLAQAQVQQLSLSLDTPEEPAPPTPAELQPVPEESTDAQSTVEEDSRRYGGSVQGEAPTPVEQPPAPSGKRRVRNRRPAAG